MSTIGSDYSSHRRSVDDLEQEYETAAKRSREREQTREAKLERNLDSIVRKKNAELESSVQNVKDEYESSMQNQAKSDRVERDKLKQTLYDRNGRRSAAVEESSRIERERALQAVSAAEARAERATAETEKYYEQHSNSQAERHEKEMEALAESYRKQIAEARGAGGEGEQQALRDYRKKLAAESQSAIRQAREEVMAERRQSKALSEQTDFVLKNREKKTDSLMKSRLHEKDLAVQAEINQHAESERTSRALELQPLREQLMDTAGLQRDAAKAKNEARAGAIQEFESEWNSKLSNQSLSHELEKQKLRSDGADTERKFGEKLGTYMKENNAKTSALVARQNADHYEELKATTNGFERSLDHAKKQAEHDQKLMSASLSRERTEANERQDRLLTSQAATYQETISKQREAQQGQIKNLERVLTTKNTTDDPGEISAAAEQSVRSAVTRQYDRTFQAEADRNARDRQHLDSTYRARLSDAVNDKQSNTANLTRQNLKEQSNMRNEFVQHVSDVEENKRQMVNAAADANTRMTEAALRSNERGMNETRRHYEELMNSRDAENGKRLEETRNQAEFEKRSMRREYRAQTADLIRTYEKKLADQREATQDENRDLKGKLDRITRDNDKRMMQALADQARGYDRRLAELEGQSKDRERIASQKFDDELDKVKKANALLLSKKG